MEEIINQLDQDGRKHGKWITGKTIIKEEHYVNGIRHGDVCQYGLYDSEKIVYHDGTYVNDKRAGIWNWYHINKNIKIRQSHNYPNDLILSQTFRESGVISEKGFLKKTNREARSLRFGIWYSYDGDGILETETLYIR